MDDRYGNPGETKESDETNSELIGPSTSKTATGKTTASSPIAINQNTKVEGKFDVIRARQAPDSLNDLNAEPIPLDKIIKTANTMSSMMMAHKIALDDDFRLEPGMDISGPLMSLSPIIGSSPLKGSPTSFGTPEPNLQSRVKDIVHEAYWDLLGEEIKSQSSSVPGERTFDTSKQLLRDIKQKMIDLLLPQHTRIRHDIEDRLDSKILDQLSKVESLNLSEYARYILSVLSKLCAPVRDDKIKELTETNDVVQIYKGIMELLELMRLDFANFTLNRFKPHIKAHSQEYEREKFNEILKQQQSIGIDGLEYTKIWLARALDKVDKTHGISELLVDSSDLEHSQGELYESIMTSSGNEKEFNSKREKIIRSDLVNRVLNAGYCELLEWPSDKQKLYPETLLLDEATFKQLSEQYKILVLTSSILLTTFAFYNRFRLPDDNDFKVIVKSHVITLMTAAYDDQSISSVDPKRPTNLETSLDRIKLETIAASLSNDIKRKILETDGTRAEDFESQQEVFHRQILDLENSSNRVKDLARRRILEFVETLLTLDTRYQCNNLSSRMPPPVNIPLGLNCLTDEITLTMAQLVKIIRYNRTVFFNHYKDIIVKLVTGEIKCPQGPEV